MVKLVCLRLPQPSSPILSQTLGRLKTKAQSQPLRKQKPPLISSQTGGKFDSCGVEIPHQLRLWFFSEATCLHCCLQGHIVTKFIHIQVFPGSATLTISFPIK